MDKKKISALFNQFAGKEVQVNETHLTIGLFGGEKYIIDQATPVPDEPTLKAMEKAAHDNGLTLRVWSPGSVGTMDYRTDRVNVYIEKAPDGKHRVSKKFHIG